MSLFAAFLKLEGRPVVVVGGGALAEAKIPGLLEAGALVHVVSPEITPLIADWVRQAKIAWWPRFYEPGDLRGAFLVVATTSLDAVNQRVYLEAEALGILCNVVDDLKNSHFYYGAVVQRGDLQIAISTNGKSPALAQRLRKELEGQFGSEYAVWVEWLGAVREVLRAQGSDPDITRRELHLLASRPMFQRFLEEANDSGCKRGVS
jgi:precorrin-2 dehydrogenase / sirohydrochlorin ferrochelatase